MKSQSIYISCAENLTFIFIGSSWPRSTKHEMKNQVLQGRVFCPHLVRFDCDRTNIALNVKSDREIQYTVGGLSVGKENLSKPDMTLSFCKHSCTKWITVHLYFLCRKFNVHFSSDLRQICWLPGRHKISRSLEFRSDRISHFGRTCSWAPKKFHIHTYTFKHEYL